MRIFCGRIAVVLVAFQATNQAARAETFYVRASGDDRADGKSAQAAFRSVNRAAGVLNHNKMGTAPNFPASPETTPSTCWEIGPCPHFTQWSAPFKVTVP